MRECDVIRRAAGKHSSKRHHTSQAPHVALASMQAARLSVSDQAAPLSQNKWATTRASAAPERGGKDVGERNQAPAEDEGNSETGVTLESVNVDARSLFEMLADGQNVRRPASHDAMASMAQVCRQSVGGECGRACMLGVHVCVRIE